MQNCAVMKQNNGKTEGIGIKSEGPASNLQSIDRLQVQHDAEDPADVEEFLGGDEALRRIEGEGGAPVAGGPLSSISYLPVSGN